MPAKKAASKKSRAAKATRKKTAKRKSVARKKPASKKSKVTKKKATRKKATKKKATKKKSASRKKVTKKKATRKKASKKKKVAKSSRGSRKKSARKSTKKARKKRSTKKKPTAKKATRKKASAKKSASRKKAASKRPIRKSAKKPARKTAARRSTRRKDLLSGPIHGIDPYSPKRGENYMSDSQLKHFEAILLAWKRELMNEVDRTVHHMQDEAANFPDPNDRATQESEFGLELRTRDRERKLLRKINSALARIEDGSYGYCEETGEEIGLKRLEARPVATLCVEAQERREMAEKQFRDRDDRYR